MEIAPMLAKAVPDVPDPDSVQGGLRYEPKWDGFRGIVTIDGDDVEIGSRGAKPLTRYFPELVEAFRAQFGGHGHPVVLDGEVILRARSSTGRRCPSASTRLRRGSRSSARRRRRSS
jgi:ATP-dependent DNA ligase